MMILAGRVFFEASGLADESVANVEDNEAAAGIGVSDLALLLGLGVSLEEDAAVLGTEEGRLVGQDGA